MTRVEKKWKILKGWKKKELFGQPKWLLSILANRTIETEQQISSFLEPKYEELLNPDIFENMEAAITRIEQALLKQEKVIVYGDYDVDGVTSTALMYEFLRKVGLKNVETYIPHREEEGYGLNDESVSAIIKAGAKLIVTVDCGITSKEIVDSNADKIDFLVVDHHEISKDKTPTKAILLHPRLRMGGKEIEDAGSNLSACGMAFFLVKKATMVDKPLLAPGQEKWFLDLVALSTICDIVPLIGQNRILAKYGITVLNRTRRVGLQALSNISSIDIAKAGSYEIGFVMGPRLNAAGRMKHAKMALDLLLTDSKSEAIKMASELNKINIERQQLCERIVTEAKAQVETQDKDAQVFLLSDKNWPRGVVGIIASRMVDVYQRPVIIFEESHEGFHGSARSVDGFDITSALSEASEHIEKFGGHAKAAGLTVLPEHWILFKDKLLEVAKNKIIKEELSPILNIDTEIDTTEISDGVMDLLEKLEPHGLGNVTPSFVARSVAVTEVNRVGKSKEHIKFKLKTPAFSGISFYDETPLKDEDVCDIVFALRYNIWNERKSIELRVIDLKIIN